METQQTEVRLDRNGNEWRDRSKPIDNRCTCHYGRLDCKAKKHWRRMQVGAWYTVPWTAKKSRDLHKLGEASDRRYSRIFNEVPEQGEWWGREDRIEKMAYIEKRSKPEQVVLDSGHSFEIPPWDDDTIREWTAIANQMWMVVSRCKVSDVLDLSESLMLPLWKPKGYKNEPKSLAECLLSKALPGADPFPNVVVFAVEAGTGRFGWAPAAWWVRDLVRIG
jgi:hypothetical protein